MTKVLNWRVITAPPDAQNLGIKGEDYIEALFVFESLE
jgi:aldose 1-epimerase